MIQNLTNPRRILLAASLLCTLPFAALPLDCRAENTLPTESNTAKAERMKWFVDAKNGLFIHWGLYSIPAGVHWKNPADTKHAEWYLQTTQMPVSEYEKFADQFNPVKFDAEQWAQIAQDAGMKYICITSMHHDGFAMFPSKVSDRDNWSLNRTPFGKAGRDPLMELKKACEKRGIKFCLYHTIFDWHSPLYTGRRAWNDVAAARGIKPDNAAFQQYVEDSVLEVIERYHPDMLWFDGNWEGNWTLENGKKLEAAIRKADPNVIINNRIAKGKHDRLSSDMGGDYLTPEQHIPAQGFGKDIAFEACMTMSGHNYWGINKADNDAKSVKPYDTVFKFLTDLSAKGGNMLINVGPTAEGEIPDFYVPHLKQLGDWLKVNGEAIYGTRAGIYSRQPGWGRTTTRRLPSGDTRVYAILFESPKDGVLDIAGLKNAPVKAVLLADGAAVKAESTEDGVRVTLPESARGVQKLVVAVDVKGEVIGEAEADLTPKADKDGVVALKPGQASLENGLTLQGEGDAENLGHWTSPAGAASWSFENAQKKTFALDLRWSAPAESAGSMIEVDVRGPFGKEVRVLPFEVKSTGAWEKFDTANLGTIDLPAGRCEVTVRAKKVNGLAPCNLGTLRLVPAK